MSEGMRRIREMWDDLRQRLRAVPPSTLRSLRFAAIATLLALSVLAFIVALFAPFGGTGPTAGNNGLGGRGAPTISPPTATAIAAAGGWVALPSASPTAVAGAARDTPLFQLVAGSSQLLSKALQTGTLGTPVLVHAYRQIPGNTDMWVVPVYPKGSATDSGAAPVALLDFTYDAADKRIHAATFAGPFVPADPEYGKPFPQVTAALALARLEGTRGIQPAPGTQPELVYVPIDLDKTTGPTATIHWTGGGQFPDMAIWLIHGADGTTYLVGLDEQVYTSSQLPLVSGAPAA